MSKRPPIPAELERAILLEAGHRCAIHTCRQTPLEMAHITPWSKCKNHTYDNIIALCPTCHTRFDKGEIDRKSMIAYKANLLLFAGRFTQFELRILRKLRNSNASTIWLFEDFELAIEGLLDVGYLIDDGQSKPLGTPDGSVRKRYRLTISGESFIQSYLES